MSSTPDVLAHREPTPPDPVLVTGAPGWLGSALVRRLRALQRPVRCLVYPADWPAERLAAHPELHGVELIFGDVRDPAAARRAVTGVSTVFHLAGLRHPRRARHFHQVNVEGTRHVAEAAARAGVECFVHVSSISVHGFNSGPDTPFEERSATRPNCPYGVSKAHSEAVIERLTRAGLRSVILRPGPFYGPGQSASMDRLVNLVARASAPNVGDSRWLRSFAHVENVVDALLHAEGSGVRNGQAYLIGDQRPYTVYELLAAVADALSTPLRTWDIPVTASRACEGAGRVIARFTGLNPAMLILAGEMGRHAFCTSARARSELGYRPVRELHEGVRAAIAELRDREPGLLRR